MIRPTLARSLCVVLVALAASEARIAAALEPILTSSPLNVSQAELEIRGQLTQKVTLEFKDTPLAQVMAYLHDKYHMQILFDTPAFTYTAENGEKKKTDPAKLPITLAVKDISLRSALNLILAPQGLAWTIKDEVLMITTQEAAAAMLETRVYDVHDLVIDETDRSATPDFDSLVDTIHATVNPQTWDTAGGQGSISGFASNGIVGLSVWQNYDGQEQVETLLAKLRSLRPVRAVRQ